MKKNLQKKLKTKKIKKESKMRIEKFISILISYSLYTAIGIFFICSPY